MSSVERYGYREYYNPLSGVGHAARNFGMATLLVELLGAPRAQCAYGLSGGSERTPGC